MSEHEDNQVVVQKMIVYIEELEKKIKAESVGETSRNSKAKAVSEISNQLEKVLKNENKDN